MCFGPGVCTWQILYLVNVAVAVLVDIGWRVPGDSSKLIANLVYIFYFGFVVASVSYDSQSVTVGGIVDR